MSEPVQPPSGATEVKCGRCATVADYMGRIPVMTGGSGAVAKLIFGQWAEAGEGHWPIDVWRCPQCGHVELFDLSGRG